MKLNEMGTTGLVEYVLAAPGDRTYRQRMGAALRTIRARYGERPLDRFRQAVDATAHQRIEQSWREKGIIR